VLEIEYQREVMVLAMAMMMLMWSLQQEILVLYRYSSVKR